MAAAKGSGRVQEAGDLFCRALVLQPASPRAYYNVANALKASARLEEAAIFYREALTLDPAFTDAWTNLGNLMRALVAVERRRRTGIGRSGAADQLDRLQGAALRRAQNAEVVQGQRMVGLRLQRGLIELRGPVGLSALMPLQGLLEQGFDVGGRFGEGSRKGKSRWRHDRAWAKSCGP